MTQSQIDRMTDKWLLVLQVYEQVKQKRHDSISSVNELCELYKVNRKDISKYYERWVKSGKDKQALLPHKRGPKPGSLKILSKDEERAILKINRRLGSNEFEIYELIKDHRLTNGNHGFHVHPSVSTIYRTFKRYPLNKVRKDKIKRYEKMYPGELVHVDTYQLAKTLMLDNKKHYLFGAIDDCTRLAYVDIIERPTAAHVARSFFNSYKWFHAHGFKIDKVMSDNGPEFTSYTSQKAKGTHFFETMLNITGIKHTYTRPYRPQTNGKIERFWKMLWQECIRLEKQTRTREEFVAALTGYMWMYNYERRNGGIKYQTPLQKLIHVTEIMK